MKIALKNGSRDLLHAPYVEINLKIFINFKLMNQRIRRQRTSSIGFEEWCGFFHNPENVDPDKKYDPKHSCIRWKPCCSKNLLLKPSNLLEIERDPSTNIHKRRVEWLKNNMKKQKKHIIDNLKDNYENTINIQKIQSMLKTYIWFLNELSQIMSPKLCFEI